MQPLGSATCTSITLLKWMISTHDELCTCRAGLVSPEQAVGSGTCKKQYHASLLASCRWRTQQGTPTHNIFSPALRKERTTVESDCASVQQSSTEWQQAYEVGLTGEHATLQAFACCTMTEATQQKQWVII